MEKRILDAETVRAMLPDRDPWGHKGDVGKLLLLCGSVGYTGGGSGGPGGGPVRRGPGVSGRAPEHLCH
ncbi:MAG: hypothetical protein ACLVHV_11105 [Oscillospiraceae bacterium]